MLALILMIAAALAGTADFKAAYSVAFDAAGTSEFASAIEMAQGLCTSDVKGCAGDVIELRELDRKQRAYLARNAPRSEPAKRAPEPEPDALAFDLDDEEEVPAVAARVSAQPAPAAPARPVVYVDQPTGLDYVASTAPPPAPWTGMQVTNLNVALPGVQKVCVMRGGAPLPLGGEVPFSFSHDQGSGIFTCPAAMVFGDAIYAPAGSTLYLAKMDSLRQVYVVEKAYTCNPPSNATDRVARKTVTACIPQRVR